MNIENALRPDLHYCFKFSTAGGAKMDNERVSPCLQNYWQKRSTVPGAFWDIDFLLFDRMLRLQRERRIVGDLLEIGALYGKSAIVLGCHARPAEKVIVCDIFDESDGDSENIAENSASYSGLNRSKFEQNYRRWVGRPAHVIAKLSEHLVGMVEPKSLRFAHVDGSHLYSVVRPDIMNTRDFMNDNGVVVVDDFRGLHTPGVAAALWDIVANDGLIPICISEQKFYGAWNVETAEAFREDIIAWADSQGDALNYGVQDIANAKILIIQNPPPFKRYNFSLKFPIAWDRARIVLNIPIPWIRHKAAVRLIELLNRAWFRPFLGSRPGDVK